MMRVGWIKLAQNLVQCPCVAFIWLLLSTEDSHTS